MDEAEKYQQRLQAIAEKRRLQEEEDRARRALEDEKLRMQQLKRKSLRDQWLMESPLTSPDPTGPHSPLWGPKAQQMEANIHKLQSETERLSEAVGRIQEHIENSSDSAEVHTGHHGNGEGDSSETAGQSVEVRGVTDIAEKTLVAPPLTNGTSEVENSHKAPLQDGLTHANGLAEGAITLTFLGFSEAEPGQGVCDDDSAIIRAERVIITDEGEEVLEVPRLEVEELVEREESADDREEDTQAAENHLETCGADQTGEATVTEVENNDTDANADADADASADADANADASADADANADAKAEASAETSSGKSSENLDASAEASAEVSAEVTTPDLKENAAEGDVEHTVLEQLETNTGTLHDAVEAFKASMAISELSAAAHSDTAHQEVLHPVSLSSNSTAPAPCSPSQFQDIPLDGAVEVVESSRKQPTDGQLVEEQPLLASKAAPLSDTAGPSRTEGVGGPKTKTCQCCTVM